MAGADAVAVTVAAHGQDGELMVGELGPGGDRQSAAVQGVQPVGFDVVRGLAGTADSGNREHVVRLQVQFSQRLADGVEDAEVAAARAPVGMVGGAVVGGSYPEVGGHRGDTW